MTSPSPPPVGVPPLQPRATADKYAMPSLAAYSLRDSLHAGPSTASSSSGRTRPRSATTSTASSAPTIGAAPPSPSAPSLPSLRNIYNTVPRSAPPATRRKRGNTISVAAAPSSQSRTSPPSSRRLSYPHPTLPHMNGTRHLSPPSHTAPYQPPQHAADPPRQESVSEMMKRATLDNRTSPFPSPESHSPVLSTIPDAALAPLLPGTMPSPPGTMPSRPGTANILNRIGTITRSVELTIQTLLFRIFRAIQFEFLRYPSRPSSPIEGGTNFPAGQTATSGYMCLLLLGHIPPQNHFDAAWLLRVQERLQAVHNNPELLNAEEGGVYSVQDIGAMFQMLRVLVGCIRRVSDVMVRSGVLRPPGTAPATAPQDSHNPGVKEAEKCDPGFALPKYPSQGVIPTGPSPLDLIAPEMAHAMESLTSNNADPAPPAKRARPMAPLPGRSPPAAPQGMDSVHKTRAWLLSQASFKDSVPHKRPLEPEP